MKPDESPFLTGNTMTVNWEKRYPLLNEYKEETGWSKSKPLTGKRCLMVLHLLRDLLAFIEAAEDFGLEPDKTTIFYKNYKYPYRKDIGYTLQEWGYDLKPTGAVNNVLMSLQETQDKILIVEDGGYLVPAILKHHPKLISRVMGVVEQTTKGINRIKKVTTEGPSHMRFPVISLPAAELKQQLEPKYIGQAAVKSLQNLISHRAINRMKVAVLGYGAIGEALSSALAREGAWVTIFDVDVAKRICANNVMVAKSAKDAVSGKALVIGATGSMTINRPVLQSLEHNTLIASVSSEQCEFDMKDIKRLSVKEKTIEEKDGQRKIGTRYKLTASCKEIVLLADGYPVNFWKTEGMPDQIGDFIMSCLFLAMIELADGGDFGLKSAREEAKKQDGKKKPEKEGNGIRVKAMDMLLVKHDIANKFENAWGMHV